MKILLAVSVIPVILVLLYIYRTDKNKEPVRMLVKAFLLGMLAIPITLLLVGIINSVWTSNSVFYSAFAEAGIPEELAKFSVLFMLVWRSDHFDEYFDGIVYAVFVSMGFACIENIMYVFDGETVADAFSIALVRALISIPGHALFAIAMGFFLALAKLGKPELRALNIILCLIVPMALHGTFDWLLMKADAMSADDVDAASFLMLLFYIFDFFLWRLGRKYFKRLKKKTERDSERDSYKTIKWDV